MWSQVACFIPFCITLWDFYAEESIKHTCQFKMKTHITTTWVKKLLSSVPGSSVGVIYSNQVCHEDKNSKFSNRPEVIGVSCKACSQLEPQAWDSRYHKLGWKPSNSVKYHLADVAWNLAGGSYSLHWTVSGTRSRVLYSPPMYQDCRFKWTLTFEKKTEHVSLSANR